MRKKKERQEQRRPLGWADAAARVVEEFEDEDAVYQVRFTCTQNAIRLDAQADRMLTMVFLASIAGSVALLLTANLDFWVGTPIFLALACFVLGLGQTVLHAHSLGRLVLRTDAIVIEDESSAEEFERLQRKTVDASDSQRFFLLLGALLAAGGMVAHFWQYAWRAALIAVGFKALFEAIRGLKFLAGKVRR
jgi:fatty acid desaturase